MNLMHLSCHKAYAYLCHMDLFCVCVSESGYRISLQQHKCYGYGCCCMGFCLKIIPNTVPFYLEFHFNAIICSALYFFCSCVLFVCLCARTPETHKNHFACSFSISTSPFCQKWWPGMRRILMTCFRSTNICEYFIIVCTWLHQKLNII